MLDTRNEVSSKFESTVSIGLPVFNSESTIKAAIESIIHQSFKNWVLIISDNNSSDQTVSIIEEFLIKDNRIFLYKQENNIGMYQNYEFVLKKSIGKGKYFHWLASDDTRSINFLEENITFLEENNDYIASCSIKFFGSKDSYQKNNKNFKIDQETSLERINFLLSNIWQSHSIYFSVMRIEAIKNCQYLAEHYLGQDWIINIFLAKNGKIALQKNSHIIIGEYGISRINPFDPFRLIWIEYFVPFYSFHKRFKKVISSFKFLDKQIFEIRIIYLHIFTFKMICIRFIKKLIKTWFKKNKNLLI